MDDGGDPHPDFISFTAFSPTSLVIFKLVHGLPSVTFSSCLGIPQLLLPYFPHYKFWFIVDNDVFVLVVPEGCRFHEDV